MPWFLVSCSRRSSGAPAARPEAYLQPNRYRVDPVSARQVLGEEVGRIDLPLHLTELDGLVSNSLLDPECPGVHVAQLAQALAAADAHRGTGVGPYSDQEPHSEVFKQRLVPERHSSSLDDAVELSLP